MDLVEYGKEDKVGEEDIFHMWEEIMEVWHNAKYLCNEVAKGLQIVDLDNPPLYGTPLW